MFNPNIAINVQLKFIFRIYMYKKINIFFLQLYLANFPESVVNELPGDLSTGVYYGWASLHGQVYKMVSSIGWNPYYKNEKKSMVREITLRN